MSSALNVFRANTLKTILPEVDMQGIILAAGHSTRCFPLTVNIHKALLNVANKRIMDYNLDCFLGLVDEVIIVIGNNGDKIKKVYGDNYKGLKLTYFRQRGLKGTGDAMIQVSKLIKDSFILMHGDDIYNKEDIKQLAKFENAILVSESENPELFGVIQHKAGKVTGIIEKPKNPKSKLVNDACYILENAIFEELKNLSPSERGELEFTDAITAYAKQYEVNFSVAKNWIPIGYSWDLLVANEKILRTMKKKIQGKVERGATVKGKLILGKGSIIKSGAYLEGDICIGENTVIGPNCYIRGPTSIGSDCKVGNAVEIKNAILMDGAKIGHLGYFGDSIMGEKSNFGAGTKVANLRHDGKNVFSAIKEELVDTGRRKLGAIIAEHVHTGINTSIYPGRKLWPNTMTLPGEVVQKDITE